jgi:phenylacetate-CoA ligase
MVASLRGSYLRHWRYGPESEELTKAALERERWSQRQWTFYIDDRLRNVLQRAATQVPYYRNYWAERRLQGHNGSWERLENWPILEKKTVRENPNAFLADDCNPRTMFCEYTSGTTGTPLQIWSSRTTIRQWYALVEARWRRWNGVTRNDRWAIVGGQLVTPVEQSRPPFWVWNASLKQLYMSSYHLAPRFIPYYLEALEDFSIKYLWGYSSSLYALAQEALLLNKLLKLEVVIANAEPLFQYQRESISKAFGCQVRETYGMCEMVAAASECEFGQLHLWPEVGFTETLCSEDSCVEGAGDLVCTSLLNSDMPLVRYRVGDVGVITAIKRDCSCGRSLPVMSSIEGRTDDLLYTADGRILGRLDPVFKGILPIRAAQIVQEEVDRVRVRYIPSEQFTEDTEKSILAGLRARMGDVHVVFEKVEDIPRQANGKFRAVVCDLSPEKRQAVTKR